MKAQAFVLIGLLLMAGACSKPDTRIVSDIKRQLAADDLLKARDIMVETNEGVVTLSGALQSQTEAMQALEIARATRGVVNVVDDLAVTSEPRPAATSGRDEDTPAMSRANVDPGVTAEIKVRLLADPMVSGLAINVDTSDRVVTLSGAVASHAERDRALQIARGVENVVRVDDQLTLRAPDSR
jgi:hyperosmotically inducible protein